MRTVIIIAIGFILWGIFWGVARFFGKTGPAGQKSATNLFVVVWFLVAGVNMWVGVTQAGYGFLEELPIFLAIFLIPSVTALLVSRKLRVERQHG